MNVKGNLKQCLVSAIAAQLAAGLISAGPVWAAAKPLTVCASGCAYTSIQTAIDAAPSGGTIQIGADTFAGGLSISQSVTLVGAGASQTTIQGGNGVINIGAGTVTIKGVTVTGGSNCGASTAGGINIGDASLALKDSVVTNNGTLGGCNGTEVGGITNAGTLTASGTTISDNQGPSVGGIFNPGGEATLNGSTVSGNRTQNGGGGIENTGTLKLNDSTVTGNAASAGGGIETCAGALTLNDSTISGNTPDDINTVTCN